MQYGRVATLVLIVGLPGAGKTTQAKELAAQQHAIRLTPDEWMIPLFGLCWREPLARGKRDVLEGRLISIALQALRLETSVVLDFGFWGRDERSSLRWLARSAGASCQVVYLPVGRNVQLARIARRQLSAPQQTYLITEVDVDRWREQFQAPDAAELDGNEIPGPPAGLAGMGSGPLALPGRRLAGTRAELRNLPRARRRTRPRPPDRRAPLSSCRLSCASRPRPVRSARCARPSRASSPPPLPSRPGRRCSGSGRGTP